MIVNWPSILLALLVDSALVWGPAIAVFALVSGYRFTLPLLLVAVFLAINSSLYAQGSTLGTCVGGFRLRTRQGGRPGWMYGLIFALANALCIPVLAVIMVTSFIPGSDISSSLGRADSYPLRGERIYRRRFLQAFDNYWARWSN